MKLFFITPSGTTQEVSANPGETLMQAATYALVPGINADCGGCCSCATCHVLLPKDLGASLKQVHPPSAMENELLENSNGYCAESSRLACQITITEDMDGIVVGVIGA